MNKIDGLNIEATVTNLIAKTELRIARDSIRVGEKFQLVEGEATEFLLSGKAKLNPFQATPPNLLLAEIITRLKNLELIGPKCLDRALLKKFETETLSGGRRTSILGATGLRWISTKNLLGSEFVAAFDFLSLGMADALNQLATCRNHIKSRVEKKSSSRQLTDQEMLQAGEFSERSNIQRTVYFDQQKPSGPFEHYQVGQAWAGYMIQLQKTVTSIEQSLMECLRLGRILTVEELPGGAMLFVPWQWEGLQLTKKPWRTSIFSFRVTCQTLG